MRENKPIPILNMRLSKAKNVLSLNGIKMHRRGHGSIDTMTCNPKEVIDALLKVGWCAASIPYIINNNKNKKDFS